LQFCHQCGYNLQLGFEKFCPKCGFNLHNVRTGKNDKSINVTHTNVGDIFDDYFKDNKNIIAKDTKGNVFNFKINSISRDQLKIIVYSSTTLDPTSSFREYANTNIKNLNEIMETKRQTNQVLDEINKIEKEEGRQIQEIKIGDLQISKNYISLKEYLLQGNERYYIQDYDEAIKWYDKAINLDINNSEAWFDKGCALGQQKKYNEAIECYDKALAIKPDYVDALNNKGWTLSKMKKYNEAIECYDNAFTINSDKELALNNNGTKLHLLKKYNEAIECYDKALAIKPDYVDALNNKGRAFYKIERYNEAIECYDKALAIKPNYELTLNNKRLAQKKLGESKDKKSFFSIFKNKS
jgi:tetratricopeptide (TPR) repeat protein